MATFSVSAGSDGALNVAGELDLAAADEFATAVLEHATGSSGPVVLDFAGVEFLDSTGVSALVRIRNTFLDQGRTLSLRNVAERPLRVLQITAMDAVFEIENAPQRDGV